jgi:hypothetical protein
MSGESHLKDWYVAQVVVLDNENKRLKRELEECRMKASRTWYSPPLFFAIGYFLACILSALKP